MVGRDRGRLCARPRVGRHEGRGGGRPARDGRGARRNRGEVVLHAVASEEDGGLGTFAALERDDRFDACLIPEPTGFDVVCAQAGALTFSGEVRGRGAHAAMRLRGRVGDRRLRGRAHRPGRARAGGERRRGAPADARAGAALPAVGRPDRGRRVVQLGARPADLRGTARSARGRDARRGRRRPARRAGRAPRASCGSAARALARARRRRTTRSPSSSAARRRPRPGREWQLVGVSYGADMRLFCERGNPVRDVRHAGPGAGARGGRAGGRRRPGAAGSDRSRV